ncbi:MAG: nucleotidyltransferase family protein [Clostridia bacterium]|nr:nucleotidyltransferase family protein [Clostridia bacterium]
MIFAVISEFNPFHNGHQWLLSQLPKQDGNYTVCIMSGSFVQRGEPAAYDKWQRAAAAVQGGADLVLELPVPFVLSDGDRFAAKGVELAAALGQPVTMAFGTECESLEGLAKLAALPEEALPIKEFLEQGLSYGAARQAALEKVFPQEGKLLLQPNNLLACGYIRACRQYGLGYLGIQRKVAHDGAPVGNVASASYIRAHRECFSRYCAFPQGGALDVAVAERGMMTLLKTKTAPQLKNTANITEGLENRILAALYETDGLQALYDHIKTKRYSHAKLRRAVSAAVLGIPAGLPEQPAPYLRVLAFGERGTTLLRSLRESATLPLCQNGKECERANAAFFEVERLATDLRNCWCERPVSGGEDYRKVAKALKFE